MNFPSKGGQSDFAPLPAGSYFAVCDSIIDLGVQPGSGLYPDPKHKINIRFQIPAERIEYTDKKTGEKKSGPKVISKEYTASMHENATLRAHLESWRGRAFTDDEAAAFDVSKILGLPAMLGVSLSKTGKSAVISSISGLPKGVPAPQLEGETILFDPTNQSPSEADAVFAKLPEWIQQKINSRIRDTSTTSPEGADAPPDSYWDEAAANQDDSQVPF